VYLLVCFALCGSKKAHIWRCAVSKRVSGARNLPMNECAAMFSPIMNNEPMRVIAVEKLLRHKGRNEGCGVAFPHHFLGDIGVLQPPNVASRTQPLGAVPEPAEQSYGMSPRDAQPAGKPPHFGMAWRS